MLKLSITDDEFVIWKVFVLSISPVSTIKLSDLMCEKEPVKPMTDVLDDISPLADIEPEKKWVSLLELPNVVDSLVIRTEDVISKNSDLTVEALILLALILLAVIKVVVIFLNVTSSLRSNCNDLETVSVGRLAIVCA